MDYLLDYLLFDIDGINDGCAVACVGEGVGGLVNKSAKIICVGKFSGNIKW